MRTLKAIEAGALGNWHNSAFSPHNSQYRSHNPQNRLQNSLRGRVTLDSRWACDRPAFPFKSLERTSNRVL